MSASLTPYSSSMQSNLTLNQLNQIGNPYYSYYNNYIGRPIDAASLISNASSGFGPSFGAATPIPVHEPGSSELLLNTSASSNFLHYLNSDVKIESIYKWSGAVIVRLTLSNPIDPIDLECNPLRSFVTFTHRHTHTHIVVLFDASYLFQCFLIILEWNGSRTRSMRSTLFIRASLKRAHWPRKGRRRNKSRLVLMLFIMQNFGDVRFARFNFDSQEQHLFGLDRFTCRRTVLSVRFIHLHLHLHLLPQYTVSISRSFDSFDLFGLITLRFIFRSKGFSSKPSHSDRQPVRSITIMNYHNYHQHHHHHHLYCSCLSNQTKAIQ